MNARAGPAKHGAGRSESRPERGAISGRRMAFAAAVAAIIVLAGAAGWYFHIARSGGKGFPDVDIQYVSELRRLPVLTDVPVREVSSAEMTALIDLDSDMENMTELEELLTLLLIWGPEDGSLADEFTKFLDGGVLGMYDQRTGRMYVQNNGPAGITSMTLVHEYTHALQDQHFGLSMFVNGSTTDEALALRALVEGDANLVSDNLYYWSLTDAQRGRLADEYAELPVKEDAPYALRELMMFPYSAGFDFAAYLYTQINYSALNLAFIHPPATTEQILHPEKLLALEGAVDAPLAAAPANSTVTFNDTLGEFMVRTMLMSYDVGESSAEAAAGWGGDTFVIYSVPGGHFLAQWSMAWDTERDAAEFSDAFETMLDAKLPGSSDPVRNAGDFSIMHELDGSNVSIRYGDEPALLSEWAAH